MKDSTYQLLEKSQRAIQAAQTLHEHGQEEFAPGRAYYAMFYAAEALLNERDLRFSKHGGVHGAFGEHFVKNGLLDSKYHRWLLDAFDRRIVGDYAIQATFTSQEVAEMIGQAIEFLAQAKHLLEATQA
ncbi:MAG: HEPN domain-containing protein [Chloroflexota bacterium]